MWGPALLILLATVGSVTPSCVFGDADWNQGAPLVSQVAGQNKIVVDWTNLIRDEKCVDNYFVWVWKDKQIMTQGKKFTINDFKTKTYTVTVKPCVNYNIRVQTLEKKKTKDTDIARFNTATIPTFNSSFVQEHFKVGYHKDPRTGEFDLTKASIRMGDELAQFASCIKHVEVTGKQGASGGPATTQRSYNLRSRSRTTTARPATRSYPTRQFHWGQNTLNSSLSWQPYGTGRQRDGKGIPLLGLWATQDTQNRPASQHGRSVEGSGVVGLQNELRPTTSRPGVATTTAWGYNPAANHRPTGGWSYPTTPKPPSYPTTVNNAGTDFHPGQLKPGVWSSSIFDNVFPRMSIPPSSQTAGPVTKPITSSGNDIEIVIPVEPCKEYTFEIKVISTENEELAKVTGLALPILSNVQDYIPPPLTSVIEMSFSRGQFSMDVKRQSPIPSSCLPFYLEAVDTFANRLENIGNFQSFNSHTITNYRSGFQTKLELTQEETLAKYGCKCASPHLEFKTTDNQLQGNKVFGQYHYQGMHQGYPYYKLMKNPHTNHHEPHVGTPLEHHHRPKRFIGRITTTERTTWRPSTACDANCINDNIKVCGYDGRWYEDQCEMDKQHCVNGRTHVTACITRSCTAKCDQNSEGDHWLRSGRNRPANRCEHIKCNRMYDPVCGSDGKTYSNECMLSLHNCQNAGLVEVYRKAACSRAQFFEPTQQTTTQPPWNFGGGRTTPRAPITTPRSVVSTTSIAQCRNACRTRSCKARCGQSALSTRANTTPRSAWGTTPISPWGTTPTPRREIPVYLFWDASGKQWAFGSTLGDSQTSEFASQKNSNAKCPADPNNTSWQTRSSQRSSWTTNNSLQLACKGHA